MHAGTASAALDRLSGQALHNIKINCSHFSSIFKTLSFGFKSFCAISSIFKLG